MHRPARCRSSSTWARCRCCAIMVVVVVIVVVVVMMVAMMIVRVIVVAIRAADVVGVVVIEELRIVFQRALEVEGALVQDAGEIDVRSGWCV